MAPSNIFLKRSIEHCFWSLNLGCWAGQLHMNLPEGKRKAPIHNLFCSFVSQKWFCVVGCIVLTALGVWRHSVQPRFYSRHTSVPTFTEELLPPR